VYGLRLAKMLTKLKLRAVALFPLVLILATLATIIPAGTTYAAGPAIAVSPASGVPGTTVRVTGTAFGTYASDLMQLYLDDVPLKSSSGTISGGATLQTAFIVPDLTSPGYHIISIRARGGVLAENQFYVPNPEIVLDHWSGAVGTNIKAYCKGFHAGKEVSIQYYSTAVSEVVASQTASDTGECTVQFMLPVSSTGQHDVIAKNEVGDFAQTEFEVIPTMSISPSTGGVGDKINIAGTGFNGDEVGISLHGTRIGFAPVSARGSFSYVFNVPVMQAGTYVVEIEDSSQTKRWIDFTVDAKLTLSKPTGEVGLKLMISGTAFEVGGMIQIKYDNDEVAWVMADQDGAFSTSFNVPVSTSGGHIITVSDGFNTRYIVFNVESDAPPAPKPTTPKLDSVVSADVVFDWESVYDPSEPVSYSIQISRTADFVQPILNKQGLTSSHYELTKEEALRPSRRSTYYYWRVRATDSASNQGDWSAPIAFQVEPSNVLPLWADFALGFIGLLLVIILISRVRKGTKALDAEKKETK
jgi:hypothetical protein